MASTLYDVLSGLNQNDVKLNQRKDKILSAIAGYTEPNAVSAKFAATNTLIAETSAAVIDTLQSTEQGGAYDDFAKVGAQLSALNAYVSGTPDTNLNDRLTGAEQDIDDIEAQLVGLSGEYDDSNTVTGFVTGYVADVIGDATNSVTAVDPQGALSASIANHTLSIGTKVDGITIVQSGGILESPITLKKLGSPDAAYAAQYQLQNGAGAAIGDTINIPRDQFLSGVAYDASTEKLNFTFIIADGEGGSTAQNLEVSVADMVHEYQGSDAIDVTVTTSGESTISLKLDESTAGSEAGDGKFLSVTSNGLLLSGVQDAIDAASGDADEKINALSTAIGSNYATSLTTTAKTLVGAVNELDGEIGDISTLTGRADAETVAASLNNLDAVDVEISGVIGDLADLSGDLSGKTTVVDSLQDLNDRLEAIEDHTEVSTSGLLADNHATDDEYASRANVYNTALEILVSDETSAAAWETNIGSLKDDVEALYNKI